MSPLDFIIVAAVIGVALFIFYKALKQPIDLLFDFIKGLFSAGAAQVSQVDFPTSTKISYN